MYPLNYMNDNRDFEKAELDGFFFFRSIKQDELNTYLYIRCIYRVILVIMPFFLKKKKSVYVILVEAMSIPLTKS